MLIGLYRDNEVNNEHDLAHFFNEVETMGISTTEIQLYNMDHEIVNDYLADALSISPLHSYPLTAFLHTKTGGNPFFLKQIINSLFEQNALAFSLESNKWEWDSSIFDGSDLAINSCALFCQKIMSLSDQA